jgi:hypothetical protein
MSHKSPRNSSWISSPRKVQILKFFNMQYSPSSSDSLLCSQCHLLWKTKFSTGTELRLVTTDSFLTADGKKECLNWTVRYKLGIEFVFNLFVNVVFFFFFFFFPFPSLFNFLSHFWEIYCLSLHYDFYLPSPKETQTVVYIFLRLLLDALS